MTENDKRTHYVSPTVVSSVSLHRELTMKRLGCAAAGVVSLDIPQRRNEVREPSLRGLKSAGPRAWITQCDVIPPRDELSVRMVQVMHRHGARTPLNLLSGMPEPNAVAGEALWGQCRRDPRTMPSSGNPGSSGEKGFSLTSDVMPLPNSDGTAEYVPCQRGQLTKQGEAELQGLFHYLRDAHVSRHTFLMEIHVDEHSL